MKKLTTLFCLLISCIFAMAALAPPTNAAPRVLVAWDPNPEPDIGGYKVWYGQAPRVYDVVIDCGNVTNCIVTNLTRGVTYFFAATAYNTSSLESDFSEEVFLKIPAPPGAPGGLNVTNMLVVQITSNLQKATDPAGPWEETGETMTAWVDPENAKFFRTVMGVDMIPPEEQYPPLPQ